MIRLDALLMRPVMPETAEKALGLLNLTENLVWTPAPMAEELQKVKAGQELKTPELLFGKIPPEKVTELAVKYKETK